MIRLTEKDILDRPEQVADTAVDRMVIWSCFGACSGTFLGLVAGLGFLVAGHIGLVPTVRGSDSVQLVVFTTASGMAVGMVLGLVASIVWGKRAGRRR